jgi:Tfp pilus assembly protein PilE
MIQRIKYAGFSIVELLVVITTIGILAGIVIVSYNGFTSRANDSAVQSDLEGIAGQLEGYRVSPNNSSEFPKTAGALVTVDIKVTKNSYDQTASRNLVYCLDTTSGTPYQAFKLIAISKSGKVFLITQDGFKTTSLTKADFTTNLCSNQGMTLISEGMYQPNNWQSWVGSA